MIFKRFYDTKLAQASYLVGCQQTGAALVVDANRDVEQYLRAAADEGVRVTHVTETHVHADYVSGSRELAARTDAALLLSAEGGEAWQYGYAAEARATLLRDGDVVRVGTVRIDVMHTPGHTPEHLSFLVTDTATSDIPVGVLTGDFVFVSDVGRPDLLEKAANQRGTMESSARALFRSLDRFRQLPDHLQIWPGHGAGSACGKSLGALPSSTVGYERATNWGLATTDEPEFVRMVLDGQPEAPRYFGEMKRINLAGPRLLHGFTRPERLAGARLPALLEGGALVVDTRHAADFAAGHVPGTVNIPLNKSFTTWAGWLIPYDREFHLLIDDSCAHCIDEAVRDLAMIGLDRIAGYLGTEAMTAWAASGRTLGTVPQMTVDELAQRLRDGTVAVVDVRGRAEWEAGHLPDVPNVPLGFLAEHLAGLPTDRPIVVHCQGGGRSAIAASLLQAHGVEQVVNLVGGFAAWQASGYAVERGRATADVGDAS